MVTNEIERPTIEAVDREIEGGFSSLVFSPHLERLFEVDTRRERDIYAVRTTLLGMVLFDLYLFSDWIMLRDAFWPAVIGRIGVATPLMVITAVVMSRSPPRAVREGLTGFMTIVSVFIAMTLIGMSRSPDMVICQLGNVLIIVFATVVQRLQLRYAAATIVSIIVVQLTMAARLSEMTPRLFANTASFFLVTAVLLIWAVYVLEREQRRSYLLDLRSRILNDYLDRIAKQDSLTGLGNRRHLETVMTSAWTRCRAQPTSMSVILLDIDHFKTFNDSYGHLEGDKCLRRLAACVEAAINDEPEASAVRFGGEEFLIFIDGAEPATATRTAERIRTGIAEAAIPHPVLGAGLHVTASFGVATGIAPELPMNELVAAADNALYAAKRAGRDQVLSAIVSHDRAPCELAVAC